jgi:hypothetical protein
VGLCFDHNSRLPRIGARNLWRLAMALTGGSATRCMLAAAASLSCGGAACASDYIVEIGGTPGTPFAGTCLLVKGDGHANHDAVGAVPLTLAFSGDIISCAIVRKTGAGELRMVIKSADGRLVAESSHAQPFGVVMAAGR